MNAINKNLGTINPLRVATPRQMVQSCTPRHCPDAGEFIARVHGRFNPSPLTPLPEATTVVAHWKAWGPTNKLEDATSDIADVLSEESGELIRRGRNIYFSQARLERAQAFARADARFIAMNRTRKSKRGNDLHGFAESELQEATMQVASIESQIAFLKKALKQAHVGKLRISKKKREYAKVNLPLLKKQLTKWKKKFRKFSRIVGKYNPEPETQQAQA